MTSNFKTCQTSKPVEYATDNCSVWRPISPHAEAKNLHTRPQH